MPDIFVGSPFAKGVWYKPDRVRPDARTAMRGLFETSSGVIWFSFS